MKCLCMRVCCTAISRAMTASTAAKRKEKERNKLKLTERKMQLRSKVAQPAQPTPTQPTEAVSVKIEEKEGIEEDTQVKFEEKEREDEEQEENEMRDENTNRNSVNILNYQESDDGEKAIKVDTEYTPDYNMYVPAYDDTEGGMYVQEGEEEEEKQDRGIIVNHLGIGGEDYSALFNMEDQHAHHFAGSSGAYYDHHNPEQEEQVHENGEEDQ